MGYSCITCYTKKPPKEFQRSGTTSWKFGAAANRMVGTVPTPDPRAAAAFDKLSKDNLVSSLQSEEHRREAIEKERDLEAQRETVESLRTAIAQHDKRMAQLKSTRATELSQARLTP